MYKGFEIKSFPFVEANMRLRYKKNSRNTAGLMLFEIRVVKARTFQSR